jgi:hypothetical protein
MAEFTYKADGEVLRAFMRSQAFVRGIRGPVGSGKSVGSAVECFRRGVEQEIGGSKFRKTRFAVVRNTNPQLKTTTIKTWLDWFPEHEFGKFNWQPPFTHRIRKGNLDMEVIFISLDKPDDVKKVLSLELTGAWINEAREIPKAIVDAITMRVGRFPSERDGGPTWQGVIMDTNAPDEDHWWPIMSGDVPLPEWITEEEAQTLVKPDGWEFFSQPGAMLQVKNAEGKVTGYKMNPKRENQIGIKDRYYEQIIEGKGADWIKVYVCNLYGSLTDGKPVYPTFDSNLHVSRHPLQMVPGLDVYVGLDFGLDPSAVFAQNVRGRWHILRELVARGMGSTRFANLFHRECASFNGANFRIFGDPAGDQRAQTDENTVFAVLRGQGINARPAPSNDIALRLEAVTAPLNRLVEKIPGLLIDPSCVTIIKGFESGYHYKRINVSGVERYYDEPDKNRFSHPHDALQYLMLGGGEGIKLTRGSNPAKVVQAPRNWDVFARKGLQRPPSRIRGL